MILHGRCSTIFATGILWIARLSFLNRLISMCSRPTTQLREDGTEAKKKSFTDWITEAFRVYYSNSFLKFAKVFECFFLPFPFYCDVNLTKRMRIIRKLDGAKREELKWLPAHWHNRHLTYEIVAQRKKNNKS